MSRWHPQLEEAPSKCDAAVSVILTLVALIAIIVGILG